jgi:hypothetical protein
MYIIERTQGKDKMYFTGWRRTWTWDPENAEEYSTKEAAWKDVNNIPGSLAKNAYHEDSNYRLVKI